MLIPASGDFLRSAATEIRDNPASLSAFLDLNAATNVTENIIGTAPAAPAAPGAIFDDPERRPAAATAVPAADPQTPAMPAASETRPRQASQPSADARAATSSGPSLNVALKSITDVDEPHHERDGWLKPARTLLFIVGLTLLGTVSLSWRRNQRPTAAIIARELAATRQDTIS